MPSGIAGALRERIWGRDRRGQRPTWGGGHVVWIFEQWVPIQTGVWGRFGGLDASVGETNPLSASGGPMLRRGIIFLGGYFG